MHKAEGIFAWVAVVIAFVGIIMISFGDIDTAITGFILYIFGTAESILSRSKLRKDVRSLKKWMNTKKDHGTASTELS